MPGFRLDYLAALEKQKRVRAEALFLDLVPLQLCGAQIRPMTIRDFLLFDLAGNPLLFSSPNLAHSINLIWVLSKSNQPGPLNKIRRVLHFYKVIRHAKKNKMFSSVEEYITGEVNKFVDEMLMDMPGRYSEGDEKPGEPLRVCYANILIREVMGLGFSFSEVRAMPLSLFWQYLHLAYKQKNPEHKGDQPSDIVRRKYLLELNKQRGAL